MVKLNKLLLLERIYIYLFLIKYLSSTKITITDALGSITRMEYDAYNNLTKLTQAEGKPEQTITTYTYNSYNQMTSVTANALTTSYAYNEQGLATTVTDPRGNKTLVEYNAAGNPTKITDPLGNITTATYDLMGNPLTITDPNNKTTTNTYNAKGNLVKQQTLNSNNQILNETNYTYNYSNNITSTTDAEGKTTTYEYDAKKRLIKTTDASGGTTTFDYGTGGCASCGSSDNMTAITDAKGQTTTFTYEKGLMTKETNPLGHIKKYIYNANKQITGILDQKGQMTVFSYDSLGRLKNKTTIDDTFTYTYDALGRLTTAKNTNSDLVFTYDTKGNLTSEKDNAKNTQITYTYDIYGNRTTMTGPMGTTTYNYDNYNRLTTITDQNGKTIKYTLDTLGKKTKEELPNNTTTNYQYDQLEQITQIQTLKPNLEILNNNTYTYDKVGNKLAKQDLTGTHSYAYDNTYQLTQSCIGNPASCIEYQYDSVGNRNPSTYKHSAWNQILEDNKYTYAYDNNGNRTQRIAKDGTQKDVYTWNAENKLIKLEVYDSVNATTPITTSNYKYDALGRRIEKNINNAVTKYIYDGINIIAEMDANNTITTTYIHSNNIDEPISMTRNNKTYYYHRDSLGSITSLTDETGNIVQEYKYDSFGNITYIKDQTFIQPFTFTGREFDYESGLYYLRERNFDPLTGTFISADPISFAGEDVNLYRYVENSPINYMDPFGLFKFKDINWKTIGTGQAIGLINPFAGASLAYGGLLGLTPKETLEGFAEGMKHGWESGYYECYAKCMAGPFGANIIVHLTAEFGKEKIGELSAKTFYHLIDKRFTAWGKYSTKLVPQAAGNVARGIGTGLAGWLAYEAWNCIAECKGCL